VVELIGKAIGKMVGLSTDPAGCFVRYEIFGVY